MLQGTLIFILFLGPLIFFHELGHFFFARLFGVRVEVFSIGFGPKLLKWRRKETEYAISAIPLGGYVKMFGDDPFREQPLSDEEQKVAFNYKSKWARFWIVFGGPLANLFLAFWLYFGLVMTGEKVPETRLGNISQSSLLYDMGFRSGDALREINSKPLVSFDDLNLAESTVHQMRVVRNGQSVELKLDVPLTQFLELLSEHSPAGLRSPVFVDSQGKYFLLSGESEKFDAGFSYEEAATSSQGLKLYALTEVKQLDAELGLSGLPNETVGVWNDESGFKAWLASRGLFPVDLQVDSIVMQSPADKAGIRKNDILQEVAGTKIASFEELRVLVQKMNPENEIAVGFLRQGVMQTVQLRPEMREVAKKKVMTIGVYSAHRMVQPRMRETEPQGMFSGLLLAWDRTVDGVIKTVAGYKKLITNEVGMNNIGGPLAIAKVASDSFSISLSMFFRLMAIISINLGIINLFPIPVLDGGHIMFLGFEIVNRGPLSRRKLEFAQRLGVSFLFLLIFIALFNDITRLIS